MQPVVRVLNPSAALVNEKLRRESQHTFLRRGRRSSPRPPSVVPRGFHKGQVHCRGDSDEDAGSLPLWKRAASATVALAVAVTAFGSDVGPATAFTTQVAHMQQALTAEERATVNMYEKSTPSVVFITNLALRRDAFTMNPVSLPQGAGSGFVWDKAGHVVTNYHVIRDAQRLRVTLGDATEAEASVVGFDEDKDIAVLQVSGDLVRKLKPLSVGSGGALRVGQRVYAIGNPFGLDHTLTTGVVSGLGREIASGNTGRPIGGVIQTDAAINPGNSGGPLLNSSGQVVGINTAIYSGSGTSSGVGFALPSDMVAGIVDQIITTGHVTRPVLGISFAPDPVVEQLGLGGVLVLEARKDGPAERAGIHGTTRDDAGRLMLGDVIMQMNGKRVETSTDLYKALDKCAVGETVQLKLERGGSASQVDTVGVTLQDLQEMNASAAARQLQALLSQAAPGGGAEGPMGPGALPGAAPQAAPQTAPAPPQQQPPLPSQPLPSEPLPPLGRGGRYGGGMGMAEADAFVRSHSA